MHERLLAYRKGAEYAPEDLSALLLAVAPVPEGFIAQLFGIEQALEVSCAAMLADDPVFVFKKLVVQRRARRWLLTDASVKTFGELDQWLTGQTASSP
ncbi:MAG: hypothetical protein ACYDDA_04860 [Acidiferrobacteraceae bacterium]